MKTSSKLTAALLTTLVVGGSSAGSLFSSVLNEGSSNSLGTAGAFFSTLNLPETSVSVPLVPAPKSDAAKAVGTDTNPTPKIALVYTEYGIEIFALPLVPEATELLEVPAASPATVTPESLTASKTESIQLPEVSQTSIVTSEPVPTVVPEPEVSPTSIPTPEPTEALSIEEPSSIEP